jgi:photosystem II stability/assembly factor-like uncharacterized protein
MDPSNSQTIYAGTGGGVWKSTNGGASWVAVSSGLTDMNVYALAVDPSNPQLIYAGTFEGVVWKSSNGGASWAAFSSKLSKGEVLCLTIASNFLFAGTRQGLFRLAP